MANLERKARGAVTNEALSNIQAEWTPKHKVILSADEAQTAVRLSFPNFWANIQPNKDVYYSWSARTPDSEFAVEQSKITFEDNTLNDFAAGAGAYAITSLTVDANSVLEGTYSLMGVAPAAVASDDRFGWTVPISFTQGNVYVFRFYAEGLLLDKSAGDYVSMELWSGVPGSGGKGSILSGTYGVISGALNATSSRPAIEGNGASWYEFTFIPSANATGYVHFIFKNASGVALRCYIDDFEIWTISESKYIAPTALDVDTANYLYGDTEYERRIRWGVAHELYQDSLFLMLTRKSSAVTTVVLSEG